MPQITNTLSLDVSKQNWIKAITAKQYDQNSRNLKIQLTNDGVPIRVEQTSSSKVTMNALRPDGSFQSSAGVVNSDGTVTVPISPWMLEQNGRVVCDVSVDASNSKLSTLSFSIEVERSVTTGSSPEPGDGSCVTYIVQDEVLNIIYDSSQTEMSTNGENLIIGG